MKKKLLSLLLLAALLLSLFPLAALAEGTEDDAEEAEEPAEEAAEESREGLGNLWGLPAEDVIWFGIYEDKPVPWLVLDADQTNMGTEGVYLFSRDLMDSGKVRFDENSTLWEGSLGKEWCTNFAESAFSEAESALVPPTDKYEPATYPYQLYGITWAEMELKQEQVFFLSIPEMEHYYGSYAPDNKYTVKPSSMESYYWLRTPHYYHEDYHSMVLQSNMIHDKLPYEPWAARPCINLTVQDAIWVLPAEDEAEMSVPLPAEQEIHDWKLIVPLAEHSFQAETTALENGLLRVSYTGADTGEGARISLLIRDADGNPLALRRLAQPASAEGTLELKLAELKLPEGARLFLFCEQLNDARVSNYASPLQELKTEAAAPEALAPTAAAAETPTAPEAGGEGAETPAAPETDKPEADGKTDTEAPAQPKPAAQEKPRTDAAPGTKEEQLKQNIVKYFPVIALGLLVLMAIVLIAAAFYRRSLLPIILLILLMLLTTLVYLRLCGGRVPQNPFEVIQELL